MAGRDASPEGFPGRGTGLDRRSLGLTHLIFQSVTGMGPAVAVAVGLLVVIPFSGPTLPLFLIAARALDDARLIFVESPG